MTILSDPQFVRYERQVRLPDIGNDGQLLLIKKRVLIIGCGALGSLVGLYLAGAGVGSITIVDDDCVELSNLHRQLSYRESDIGELKVSILAREIKQRNSECRVRAINKRMSSTQIDLEVMLADIVIDCSDNFPTRYAINHACFKQKTPMVSGSAIAWSGQYTCFDYRPYSPCYQCFAPEMSVESGRCSDLGIIGPVAGVIASMQSIGTLQMLLGKFVNGGEGEAQFNYLTVFDAENHSFSKYKLLRDKVCPICGGAQQYNEVTQ
jgi:sulfur carrier protein ThiS adenylyltransferase